MEAMRNKFVLGRQSSMAPPDSEDSDDKSLSSSSSLPDNLDDVMLFLFFSSKGDVIAVEELLLGGIDVNAGDFDRRTALHVAACEGHAKVVELLLAHGADVNARDRWGSTPYADAKHYGNEDVCLILARARGGVPQSSTKAKTPMEVANPADVPEYEVRPEELTGFTHDPKLIEYKIAKWHGTQVAVKEIPCDSSNDLQIVSVFQRELTLLQKLRHPNIVQFLGAVTQSTPLRIIVEYCAGGDLDWYLETKRQLEPIKAVRYALDIARGLNYLHEWKPEAIIHAALRPRSILRDRVGRLKVADFQLGQRNFSSGLKDDHENFYQYMAPELLLSKEFDEKVDVYSFGIILYQMIEGNSEFFLQSEHDLVQYVCHENLRPVFRLKGKKHPNELQELITACWQRDPKERPSFGHIISKLEQIKPLCVKQSLWRRILRTPKRTSSLRSLSF